MTATGIDADTIVAMTRQVWTALLADGGDLLPGGGGGLPGGRGGLPGDRGGLSGDSGGGGLTATVSITGAWDGTACLTCSETAARHAATVMFATSEDQITGEEIVDAIGELINVVGGHLKRLLPGPTELSLPTVHTEGPFEVPGCLTRAYEVAFTWLDEPVVVTVWARDTGSGTGTAPDKPR